MDIYVVLYHECYMGDDVRLVTTDEQQALEAAKANVDPSGTDHVHVQRWRDGQLDQTYEKEFWAN